MPERTVLLAGLPVQVGDAETHRAFWDLVHAGNWEPATLEAISRLTDGGVYIDIGAWIGPTVITAARKASLVVAYEPDPAAAAELHRNIGLNGLTNVEVRELALLDRDGALPLGPGMLDELGLSVSSLVYGSRTVMVSVSLLDRLLHHCNVVVTDGESFRMREARANGRRKPKKTDDD